MSANEDSLKFKLGDKIYTFSYTDNIREIERQIISGSSKLSMVSNGGIVAEAHSNAVIANHDISIDRASKLYEGNCPIIFENVRAECIISGYYDASKMLQFSGMFNKAVLINTWRCLTAGCNKNVDLDGETYRIGNLDDPIRGFDYESLDSVMDEFITYYRADVKPEEVFTHALILSWLFERVSPFSDGNARMSRLLIYDYCVRHGYMFILDYSITKTLINRKKEYKDILCNNPASYVCNPYVEFMLDVIYDTLS